MTKLNAALALAAKGFKVFPITANDKRTFIVNWPDRATTDETTIRAWWTDATGNPEDHNVGVCCNDLLVIDIDSKHGNPDATLKSLESQFGQSPYIVRTPSLGYHVYYNIPPDTKLANTAKRLHPAVDTRSWHGYVLGAGSTINGDAYEWVISIADGNVEPESVLELPTAPESLTAAVGSPIEKQLPDLDIEWDSAPSVQKATDYLLNQAPVALQGQGGDHTTYAVAARLRDFAISRDNATLLMLEHWNPRCEPSWDAPELDLKVGNAYAYATGLPLAPGSEFTPDGASIGSPPAKSVGMTFKALEPFDPAQLPPRQWIVNGLIARNYVTFLASAPGAGKTQYLAQLALAIALNNPALCNRPIAEQTPVWFFNAEDDATELKRRLGAALVKHNLSLGDGKAVSVTSGVDSPLSIATYDQTKGVTINKFAKERLIAEIVTNDVGLLIVDPFAEVHGAPENDNGAMRTVTAAFREIAVRANCAVLIASHTRKQPGMAPDGTAGNQDALRGAGSQTGVARVVFTLVGMSAKEGKALKVGEADRSKYQRLDIAKGNIVHNARGTRPEWLKWESVPLGNGDSIGVLVEADLSASRVAMEMVDREEMLGAILAGLDGSRAGVSWAKVVLPLMMERAEISDSAARKWYAGLGGVIKTEWGTISKTEKVGAGGSLLTFTPSFDAFD